MSICKDRAVTIFLTQFLAPVSLCKLSARISKRCIALHVVLPGFLTFGLHVQGKSSQGERFDPTSGTQRDASEFYSNIGILSLCKFEIKPAIINEVLLEI